MRDTIINGVLRERWDDTLRTVTTCDAEGQTTRPYTDAENAAVKRADLATATALAQAIVWMVPAILRIAKAARKALRLALDEASPDAVEWHG